MSERTDLKIFIASSGELQAERDDSLKVIVEINKTFDHLHIVPVEFELDTASGNNPGISRIQDAINPLLDQCEIVVVLFYSRIGEFTLEEFNRAKKADKKIFLYLKEGFQPSSSDSSIKYTEVLALKESIEKESKIRYQKFKNISEYNGAFYKDLNKYLSDKYPSPEKVEIANILLSSQRVENKLNLYPRSKPYFTGRDKELQEFKNAIDAGDTFIAIDGPGGIGKTQFVSRCIEKYVSSEKVIWFDCTTASQFDTLISEAGYPELLKGSSKTDREKFSAFKDKIQENEFYLFFDNFQETNDNPIFKEFLIFIQQYLQKGFVIIIDRDDIRNVNLTPRPIHIEGIKEHGLAYVKALISYSYRNEINATDADLENLCEQLQGYPLAIDFAILLLSKGVTPSDIITKIVQQGDADQISERLLNAIFSRSDATQEEKDFIRQFSVFTGSVPEEAVKFVISDNLVQSATRKLQEKNLLIYSAGFYEIHPLVREFCYKELTDKEHVHNRASEFYIQQRTNELNPALEEQIFYHLAKSEQWERIENEIEDKGRQFILLGQLGLVKELLDKLRNMGIEKPIFNILLGDIAEIQGKWGDAQFYFNYARINETDKRVKAEGTIKYGEMLHRKGNIKEALPFYKEGNEFATINGFLKEKARALNDIGLVYSIFGDLNLAFEKYDAALRIRKEIYDKQGIAATLTNISVVLEKRGELDEALKTLNESLSIYSEIGDRSGISLALNAIGNVLTSKGDLDGAIKKHNESLEIAQSIGDKGSIAHSLGSIGGIYALKGKLDKALLAHQQDLEIAEIIGDKGAIAIAKANIGFVYAEKKQFDAAMDLYNFSLQLLSDIGNKSQISKMLNNIGRVLEEQGKLDEAIKKLNESLDLKLQIGDQLSAAVTYYNIGAIYANDKKKQFDLALTNFFKAYSLYSKIGTKSEQPNIINWIIGIRDNEIGLSNFKLLAQRAYESLSFDMQKHIPLNEFLKEPIHREVSKVGRNDPCPCASGKKYKNCHGLNQ